MHLEINPANIKDSFLMRSSYFLHKYCQNLNFMVLEVKSLIANLIATIMATQITLIYNQGTFQNNALEYPFFYYWVS